MNSIEKIEKKDQELFNTIADDYAKKDIIESTRIARKAITLRAVEKILNQKKTLGTVLDVGCGAGTQAFHLEGLYSKYIGVDYAEKLVDIGKELTKNIKNIEFHACNIKYLNIEKKSIDTILIVGGLHHMTNLEEIFNVFKKVAKDDCFLVAIEPQRENVFIQFLRKIRMKINPGYSSDQHFFTKNEMYEILDKLNVKSPQVEYTSYLTQPFAQVVMRPQFFFVPIVKFIIKLEKLVEKIIPNKFKKFSWCINVYCKF